MRLAGEWTAEFRIVFDYCLVDVLASLVTSETVVATCHPHRTIKEFALPGDGQGRSFPVEPRNADQQRTELDGLIRTAVAAGAWVIVLPELSVTESLALSLEHWVRDPAGPRLLVAGSCHNESVGRGEPPTAGRHDFGGTPRWRGCGEATSRWSTTSTPPPSIRPQGWPELRVYVTKDGWHLVIAICHDLLDPHAVHALSEAGANLVLVPAMSDSLMPFGGPVAQLVGSQQASVAIANNPVLWSDNDDPATRPATRALLRHPGFGRQTRAVAMADPRPGVALMRVRSGEATWLPDNDAPAGPTARPGAQERQDSSAPDWVRRLTDDSLRGGTDEPMATSVALRTAAVLVMLVDGPDGPTAVLTERSPDLTNYPGELVFAGGATAAGDSGPVGTALREAHEEVGLDRKSVPVIGTLPAVALPTAGSSSRRCSPGLRSCAAPGRAEHRGSADRGARPVVPVAVGSSTLVAAA